MKQKDFIDILSRKTTLSKKDIADFLGKVFETVKNVLLQNDEISFNGFGKFSLKHKPARTGRNPKTGAALKIPARALPVFKSSSILKEAVSKKVKVKKTEKNKRG